jgi:hypothetical protein
MGSERRFSEPIDGVLVLNHGWHARKVYRIPIYRQAVQREPGYLALSSSGSRDSVDSVCFSYILVDMDTSRSSTANEVRRRLKAGHNRFFTIEDFSGARTAIARTLSRLEHEGEVLRVRRGLYWRGVKTPLGMSHPSPGAVLEAVYGRASGVGPARLDAARLLGLTTQVGATPTFAVPYGVEGLTPRLVNRTRRTGRTRNRLTSHEIALLEVLNDWSEVVELPSEAAVRRLGSLFGSAIRPGAIAAAAATEPARVRERLRALLLASGRNEEAETIMPAVHPQTRLEAIDDIPALRIAS